MKSFKATALSEALKIVKRKDDQATKEEPKKSQEKPKAKRQYVDKNSPLYVGNLNGIDIIKSKHTQEIRNGEKKPRDRNIKNELILKALTKMFASGEFKVNTNTILIYKNSKGRFDLMALEQIGKVITIITFIQERKKDPYDYFTPNRHKKEKIVVESEREIEDIIVVKDAIDTIEDEV